MKQLVQKLFNTFGYEISRIQTQFKISGIQYEAGSHTVRETPQGEMTAKGAIQMIRERQLNELKILDICSGVGIIGLTIFSELRKDSIVKEVAFADINIFNLNSLHRTLRVNHLDQLLGNQIRCYLSDVLNHIPCDERFDIIVSNPPHYFGESFSKEDIPLSPSRLGTYDAGWDFHKSFYRQCHDYLTDRGEVWFLENGSVANEEDFLPFIEDNNKLKYVKEVEEPLDPRFFWMITQKA